MNNIINTHQHYLLNTYAFRGKVFTKAKGCYLFDENNNKYLDLITNYGVNIFGYNHPKTTSALQAQLQVLPNLHSSFANDVRAQAAKELVEVCGGKLKKVYFANSGSEAVEAALKFAFITTEKTQILAAKGSFHGKTLGALSVTSDSKYKNNLEKILLKTKFFEYGNIKSLEKLISKNTAAVILEPIQGESGIIIPSNNYLKEVQQICNKNNILLILDEIQTGTGRTGTFLASQKQNIEPDIVCLGKGLAGGMPVGATLVSKQVSDKIPKLSQTSTFGGNPLACRGILEVLNLLDEKMLNSICEKGNIFISKLKAINNYKIIEVRGLGLMIGIQVIDDRNKILKALQENNILAAPAGEDVIRLLPPYIISDKQINNFVNTFENVLNN